jgi:hypothetical protein
VIFSYFFFLSQTGVPFEFQAADALGYDESARWIADLVKTGDYYTYLSRFYAKSKIILIKNTPDGAFNFCISLLNML